MFHYLAKVAMSCSTCTFTLSFVLFRLCCSARVMNFTGLLVVFSAPAWPWQW